MSAQEREDRRKKGCSSTGLGLAAAAIGVGVGAALYYFLSKRPEDHESGASSSENWGYEPQQAFNRNNESYITDSEHTTTDTSILDDSYQDSSSMEESSETEILSSEDDSDSGSNYSYASDTEPSEYEDSFETRYITQRNSQNTNGMRSDSDTDWDVTDSSFGVPEIQTPSIFDTISQHIAHVFSPRNLRKHRPIQSNNSTSKKFRERSWKPEECSICFETMLQNQELMSLPCTHRFHVGCIGPWLEAQQTCPNCRKPVE